MGGANSVVVIYKSKYGTTKQYAEWIAQALDAPALEASKVQPSQLESYDIMKKNESERTGEDTMIIQTYGAQMDFTDINAIAPIVDYVNNLRSS